MPSAAEAALDASFAQATAEYEEAVSQRGAVERELRFAGRGVRLRFAGEALAQALLPAVAARVVNEVGGDVGVTIGLWASDARAPLGWGPGDVGPRGLVRGSRRDRIAAVHESFSGVLTLVDRAAGRILYRVRDVAGLPWWERAAPLRPALFFALGASGGQLVHAGAVGDLIRGGALLAGPSGSGKTTVALAALEHGLRYVGDDYVLLDRGVAWNLYGTAKLNVAAGHHPTAASPGSGLAAGEKLVIDVAAHSGDSLVDALPVRAVVVPCIRGRDTHLVAITPLEAMLALAPSTAFQMPFDRGAVVATLAGLVRSVPCYRLEVGDRSGDLAAAIGDALDS
jgi:hypothetical protein